MRETYLHSDFGIGIALESFYDTDLENFWTQKSIFSKHSKYLKIDFELIFKRLKIH